MDITLWHGIEYDTDEPVAVEDVIKSLEANAKLLRHSADLLADLFPGLEFQPKKISLVRLSQESPLSELFSYALVMAYQKELESEVPAIIEQLTGVHIDERYDTVVTVAVMLLAVHGISRAFDKLFAGRDKKALTETEESLIARLSKLTGVAVARIRGALALLFTGRVHQGMVLASQKVFAPTRGQRRPSIRARGGDELVPPEAVQLAQAAAGLPYATNPDDTPKVSTEFQRGVRIILHAMDKDRKHQGWAGHVPSLFDDRIPMHLEKTQSPEAIFGKGEINGDILLTREEDENGDMKPKEFLLIQAYLK